MNSPSSRTSTKLQYVLKMRLRSEALTGVVAGVFVYCSTLFPYLRKISAQTSKMTPWLNAVALVTLKILSHIFGSPKDFAISSDGSNVHHVNAEQCTSSDVRKCAASSV
ncbi:hypothetical protein AVEN_83566-1 [Araneus ventricosus]|uniref:Uncharacterized protein n=1 Tax=Araneus ventricosus TaxID=182803 RepID=A0A4Y2RAL5_ARAVE|nr:hypothetical protein AVEN_83566-1 [Araneus ventricosus]